MRLQREYRVRLSRLPGHQDGKIVFTANQSEAMMRKLIMVCTVVLLLVSGCATDPAVRSWWTIAELDFRGLKPGVTTQAEVLKLMGAPVNKSSFQRQGEEVWDYRYLNGTMMMIAWVYFDRQGRYKHFVGQPDPAHYSPIDG